MKRFRHTGRKKVVLDTNVVISATISPDGTPAKVVELLFTEAIENYTSEEIIKEIIDVFERPKISHVVDTQHKKFTIEQFIRHSIKIKPGTKISAIEKDSSDNKFLEVALEAQASYIISGDMHLKSLKQFRNVKIVSPREFLEELEESG